MANSEKQYPKRPTVREEKYVDYDEDTACWGVFGTESGYCYNLSACGAGANDRLKDYERNERAS